MAQVRIVMCHPYGMRLSSSMVSTDISPLAGLGIWGWLEVSHRDTEEQRDTEIFFDRINRIYRIMFLISLRLCVSARKKERRVL